jgi:hypothetical protein
MAYSWQALFFIICLISTLLLTSIIHLGAYGDGLCGDKTICPYNQMSITQKKSPHLSLKATTVLVNSTLVKDLQFQFYDSNTNQQIRDVNFFLNVTKGQHELLYDLFYTHNGTIVINFQPGLTAGHWQITGDRELISNGWYSPTEQVIVKAPIFQESGVYHVNTAILGFDYPNEVVTPLNKIVFDSFIKVDQNNFEVIPSSPSGQFKAGISVNSIQCTTPLILIQKVEDNSPACVTPQTAQKLAERGWGTIVKSSAPTSCPSGQTMVNGWQGVACVLINPAAICSPGYTVIQMSFGSYSCQPTNPPPLSNPTNYTVGQKVGVFTISKIYPYNVTGYYNSPYPLARPGLGDFTIMHLGDTLNPTCDGSAPLVITAINYPDSITVSIGKSMANHKGGCPICLSANSVIRTPNGDVSIKDIKNGMTILSTNSDGIVIKSKVIKISNVFVGDAHKVIDLQLADGRELFASPNHPTYDGRIIAGLKAGETYDGSKVKSIKLVPYKYQFTYDILPDSQTGDYFANGVLVGSTLSNSIK